MRDLIKILLCALMALASGVIPTLVQAQVQTQTQSYPTKPVRLIIGFPAGGPADIFGRALGQALSASLGQPVIVENKGGVGGVLGMDAVAKATPDGYTLGLNNQGSVAMAPYALTKMPYNPNKDLALISVVVKVPEAIVVHPSVPVNNFAELIAYAKANPGKLNYGSAGAGGITHLAGELLKAETGIDIVHVAYKGAAPAVTDLLGGQVQVGFFDIPVVLPHIKSGKLKAVALTSEKRIAALPEVPTTGELKYPRVISDNWYGLIAPAGTPQDIIRRLNTATVAALKSPALIEQFGKVSGIASPSTTEEYAAFLAVEQAKWSAIIKAIGFKED